MESCDEGGILVRRVLLAWEVPSLCDVSKLVCVVL